MGLTAKLNKGSSSDGDGGGGGSGGAGGRGMGIFLVFFPEEQFNSTSPSSTSSLSSFKSPTIKALLKRTNSSLILTRAQSTISVCALLIFLTLLFFTFSTFEPNNSFVSSHHNLHQYRRHLPENRSNFYSKPISYSPALQGLGTLYTRGTRAMNELVICHVSESVTAKELKLFLRGFHRSGLASKSDLLFIFNSTSTIDSFDDLIREENDLFLKLVRRYKEELGNVSKVFDFPASFDATQFVKSVKEAEKGEPIWGRRIKSNNSSSSDVDDETEFTQTSYGSVVGFGVGELDPENSLSGFLDHVPMSLRRWASYPMILGRVRRKFRHVMLVDVKEILLLGDPLDRVRNKSPESVFLSSMQPTTKHGRKISNKTHRKTINPAFIIGGERGLRRLSAAMLTEIVRSTTHNKKKTPVTESTLLTQLTANEFVQKSIRFVASTESIQYPSSLSGGVSLANQTVVRRGNSNLDMGAVIMEHICSFSIDSSVYAEC